jgi:4-hydroxy-3-methylbut-2-en-1-yl diphosphate reductase
MSGVLIAAPMRVEQLLIRSAAPGARVVRTGMGPRKSQAAAAELSREEGDALLVLGFCGGLDAESVPGDVVVADDVIVAADEEHVVERLSCDRSERLARALRGAGMRVRTGPVVCVSRIALGERRAELRASGAIAVDMESAWLAPGARGRPFDVVRVVLDSPSHELLRPSAAAGAARAARALRRVARELSDFGTEG